jgi:hypothetical protein
MCPADRAHRGDEAGQPALSPAHRHGDRRVPLRCDVLRLEPGERFAFGRLTWEITALRAHHHDGWQADGPLGAEFHGSLPPVPQAAAADPVVHRDTARGQGEHRGRGGERPARIGVHRADLDQRLGRPDGDRGAALVVIGAPGAALLLAGPADHGVGRALGPLPGKPRRIVGPLCGQPPDRLGQDDLGGFADHDHAALPGQRADVVPPRGHRQRQRIAAVGAAPERPGDFPRPGRLVRGEPGAGRPGRWRLAPHQPHLAVPGRWPAGHGRARTGHRYGQAGHRLGLWGGHGLHHDAGRQAALPVAVRVRRGDPEEVLRSGMQPGIAESGERGLDRRPVTWSTGLAASGPHHLDTVGAGWRQPGHGHGGVRDRHGDAGHVRYADHRRGAGRGGAGRAAPVGEDAVEQVGADRRRGVDGLVPPGLYRHGGALRGRAGRPARAPPPLDLAVVVVGIRSGMPSLVALSDRRIPYAYVRSIFGGRIDSRQGRRWSSIRRIAAARSVPLMPSAGRRARDPGLAGPVRRTGPGAGCGPPWRPRLWWPWAGRNRRLACCPG